MFCVLEKDEKTYKLTQQAVWQIQRNSLSSLFELDNEMQKNEIERHLYLNRRPSDDQEEKINWILNYGREYRIYLNTIKIAAMIWCFGKKGEEFSLDEFHALADWLNSSKACLDNIHN